MGSKPVINPKEKEEDKVQREQEDRKELKLTKHHHSNSSVEKNNRVAEKRGPMPMVQT